MLTIKVEGIQELNRELESFGSSIGDALEVGVMAGGMIVANQAGENILPYKTETARGTLKRATQKPPRIVEKTKMSVAVVVGPEGVPYGRIQELGGLTGRGHKTRITGKFYLTRALAEKIGEVKDEIVNALTKEINR